MATCNVRVELKAASIPAGGTVEGHIVVDAPDMVETKGITLEIAWRTHGRGDRDSEKIHQAIVYKGALSGAQRIPFSVKLPNGPLTYHGHYVNVDWSVTAKIDLSWARDPEHVEVFTMTPGAEPYVAGNRDEVLGGVESDSAQRMGCFVLFLLPFVGVGGYLILTSMDGAYLHGLVGSIFVLAALIMLTIVITKRMAASKVGPAEIVLSNTTPRPGETVRVTLRMTPAGEFEVNTITARLHGYERAEHGSGTNTVVDNHTFHDEAVVLCAEKRRLARGEPVTFEGSFVVPKDAPPAFFSMDNDVLWTASVHVDIHAWPDWKDEVQLAVLPSKS